MSEALTTNPDSMFEPGPFGGTVLEMVGVVVESANEPRTPASKIPHTVATRSGEGQAQIQDDSFQDYFLDE